MKLSWNSIHDYRLPTYLFLLECVRKRLLLHATLLDILTKWLLPVAREAEATMQHATLSQKFVSSPLCSHTSQMYLIGHITLLLCELLVTFYFTVWLFIHTLLSDELQTVGSILVHLCIEKKSRVESREKLLNKNMGQNSRVLRTALKSGVNTKLIVSTAEWAKKQRCFVVSCVAYSHIHMHIYEYAYMCLYVQDLNCILRNKFSKKDLPGT